MSSFFAALFLWAMLTVYVPSTTIFVFTFLFTGLFYAAVLSAGLVPQRTIQFFQYPRASFVTVLALVLLLLSSIVFGYLIVQKTLASIHFQRSAIALSNNKPEQAELYMRRALNLSENDIYYRSLAQIYMNRAEQVVDELETGNLSDAGAVEFRDHFRNAIAAAQQATKQDESNYRNWLMLGRIFHRGAEYGINGAYDLAVRTYNTATEKNPTNPALRLQRARLEVVNGDLVAARSYIQEARDLKPNYTEAIYLLSQIETVEGNIDEAVARTQQAILTSSANNAGLYFQLGLLHYSKEDYTGAADAFRRALRVVPNYANAKYFLGLSYYWLDQNDDAVQTLEELRDTLAPDNAHLSQVISNIRAGRRLFAETSEPVTDEITTEGELPFDEPEEELNEGTSQLPIDDISEEETNSDTTEE